MTDPKLAQKLQLKPGGTLLVLNAPAAVYTHITASLPNNAVVPEAPAPCDAVLLFAQNSDVLRNSATTAAAALKPGALFWIAYPKKSGSIKTDLSRDKGWDKVAKMGLEGVRQIALDSDWSALRFSPAASDDDGIAAQYAGKKAHLKPIYEKLLAAGLALGDDVSTNVRKGYVALHRGGQFALIKPSTQTRVDLALKLADAPQDERLRADSGVGSGSMTHAVALTAVDDVDDDVLAWLGLAYRQSSKR